MKHRLERFRRLGLASDSLASAIEVDLAARERSRQLAEERLQKLNQSAQSPFWSGLAVHSGLLREIARQEADLVVTNDDIVRLRTRLRVVRSRKKACVTEAERLNYILDRKLDQEESLEITAAGLATACGKLPMLD